MSEQFQSLPVDRACARAAYPLVCFHDSGVTLDKWLRFASRWAQNRTGRRGLMALRDRRGIVHALFSYRSDFDPQLRRRLAVGNLIVAHLPGSGIDEAVATVVGQIAAQLGCHAVTLEQPLHRSLTPPGTCPTARLLAHRHRLDAATRPH